MGAWGTEPYDNDAAADWFGWMFQESNVPAEIGATLSDPKSSPEDVRAAAWLLEQIGYVYVYPIDMLEGHLELAIGRLGLLPEDWYEEWDDPAEIRASVQKQIDGLKKRRDGEDQETLIEKVYASLDREPISEGEAVGIKTAKRHLNPHRKKLRGLKARLLR